MMLSDHHLARADELRRLQRYDLAFEEVQRALAEDPRASAPHVCAAWILRDQKRVPEAEQAAHAALAADPNDADAHHILAICLWEQGRRDEACQAFDAALALVGGRSALYLTNYARMMTSYQRYSEALIALNLADQALALDPSFADPHEVRGLALRQLGRDAEAEVALRAALRLNPQSFTAQHNLGLHDLTLGRAYPALDRFREALRLNPTSELARTNLVLALKARNPIYGRFLALVLRSQRATGRRVRPWLLLGFGGLFLLFMIVGVIRPDLSVGLGPLIGICFAAFLLTALLRALLLLGIDPIFNTLLLLDPLGRQALVYDPVDGAIAGGLIALLLSLIGAVASYSIMGDNHPVANAAQFLVVTSLVATILALLMRAKTGVSRKLAWGGYATMTSAMLCGTIAQFVSAGNSDSTIAAILLGLAGLLFMLSLGFFLSIRIATALARRRERARDADVQSRQGA
jgi:tetratricopeptide (TPR) repeat protein